MLAEITPGIATVIGAAAAIIGGLLAAAFTAWRTRTLAMHLRAIEREDEALHMLAPLVNEIRLRIGTWGEVLATDRTMPAAEAGERHSKLNLTWQEHLSWRLRDESVRSSIEDLIAALRTAATNNVTNEEEVAALRAATDSLNQAIDRNLNRRK